MAKNTFETQEHHVNVTKSKEYVSEIFVEALRNFAERFGEPKVVYYPSSSTDVTPAVAFPNARIIFLDIDQDAMNKLKESGKEAVEASAITYIPDVKVDLLILFNPAIDAKLPARHVKLGGFVFCNNWHASARQLAENDEFELVGIAINEKNSKITFVTGEESQDVWSSGIADVNVDSGFIFQRIKESPQSNEEAIKEYEDLVAERARQTDELISRYKEVSISIDDI